MKIEARMSNRFAEFIDILRFKIALPHIDSNPTKNNQI